MKLSNNVRREDVWPYVEALCAALHVPAADVTAIDVSRTQITVDLLARDDQGRPMIDPATRRLAEVLAVWKITDEEQPARRVG